MAAHNTNNLITELERRYLECSICTYVFDEDKRIPRLLPCHHPFCSECLKRLSYRKDTIKCPTCNAVHKVKKNVFSDFQKDNTRRDLASFLQTYSDQNAKRKCFECGHTMDVTYKFQQCKINLCGMCRQQHITENKTHTLMEPLIESAKENHQKIPLAKAMNKVGKYFAKKLEIVFIFVLEKIILAILFWLAIICIITKLHLLLAPLLDINLENPYARRHDGIMRMVNRAVDIREDNRRPLGFGGYILEEIERFTIKYPRINWLLILAMLVIHKFIKDSIFN